MIRNMKVIYTTLFVLCLAVAGAFGNIKTPETLTNVIFTENKGQIHDQFNKARPDVLYCGSSNNLVYHIKKNGVTYQLGRIDSWKESIDEFTKEKTKVIDKQTIYRLDVNWLNANKNFKTQTEKPIDGYNNYYLENCPNGALNVKSYGGVQLINIYTNINLHYYSKYGQLKYDYIVAPNTDYKQIQLEVNGVERITKKEDGSLQFLTPLGIIEEGAPIVYQNGKQLKAAWVVSNNILSFTVENVNTNYELIIDPGVRLWGTYYGEHLYPEQSNGCAVDAAGNSFMAGYVTSSNFSAGTIIATVGSFQSSTQGSGDAFLAKFNPSGARIWGTYYGTNGIDFGLSCATDASNNIYMAGYTNTTNTILATSAAHQITPGGGSNNDAFLVKFNSAGVRQWGTYYGGNLNELGRSCSVDASGNVFLIGETQGATGTVIATASAHQSTFGGGTYDAFVAKFSTTGVRQWATFYGGNANDFGYGSITNGLGDVFFTGYTNSSTGTIIATAASHQSVNAGVNDAYLVKLNSSGVRQWGTYYGGGGEDYGFSCSLDAAGAIFICGSTTSTNSISSSGSHQTVNGGTTDGFLAKFNTLGVRQWGTYFGGSSIDIAYATTTNSLNQVYITGLTASTNSISSLGSHQPNVGGTNDAFLTLFNSLGQLQWSTYFGGIGDDRGYGCAADALSNVYMTGRTTSTVALVISTPGTHQITGSSATNGDGFLTKFRNCLPLNPVLTTNAPICEGANLNFTSTLAYTNGLTYIWNSPTGFFSNSLNPSISNASIAAAGVYSLNMSDGLGCSEDATVSVVINSNPTVNATSSTSLICIGQSASLTANGANTYSWNLGASGPNITVSPTITTNYVLSGTSLVGCTSSIAITQNVSNCAGIGTLFLEQSILHVYPNPSNGMATLTTEEFGVYTVINMLGVVVKSFEITGKTTEINFNGLSAGVYYINNKQNSKRIILK